jgi:hypothetical protein
MLGWLRRLQHEHAACRLARAAFDHEHPEGRSHNAIVLADEPERHVVRVFYGDTRPPGLAHYAVPKRDGAVAELLADDAPYRPKVWR